MRVIEHDTLTVVGAGWVPDGDRPLVAGVIYGITEDCERHTAATPDFEYHAKAIEALLRDDDDFEWDVSKYEVGHCGSWPRENVDVVIDPESGPLVARRPHMN